MRDRDDGHTGQRPVTRPSDHAPVSRSERQAMEDRRKAYSFSNRDESFADRRFFLARFSAAFAATLKVFEE